MIPWAQLQYVADTWHFVTITMTPLPCNHYHDSCHIYCTGSCIIASAIFELSMKLLVLIKEVKAVQTMFLCFQSTHSKSRDNVTRDVNVSFFLWSNISFFSSPSQKNFVSFSFCLQYQKKQTFLSISISNWLQSMVVWLDISYKKNFFNIYFCFVQILIFF